MIKYIFSTIQIAPTNTSQDRTTEPSVEASQAPLPQVKFTHTQYCHTDETWDSEPGEVLSSELDADNIFLKNDTGSDSE